MDKNLIREIDVRIRACLDVEERLDYLDSMLRQKKISKLEYETFKHSILKNKSESQVRKEINSYLEKALSLKRSFEFESWRNHALVALLVLAVLLSALFALHDSSFTGLAILNATDEISSASNNSTSSLNTTPSVLENPLSSDTAQSSPSGATDSVAAKALPDVSVKDHAGKKVKASTKRVKQSDLEPSKRFVKNKKSTQNTTSSTSDPEYVEVVTQNSPVKSVVFDAKEVESSASLNLRIDDVPETISAPRGQWTQVYAIDPTQISFTNATVTVTATGTTLYKCKAWNFDAQRCDGTWVLFKNDLVPGQDYTFMLTPDDPGFGEIIATSAQHLDGSYGFISDIFDSIKTQDGTWSEQIPEGHIVRVTFEKNLTDENKIDIVAQADSPAYFDIYEAGTQNKVGRSAVISGSTEPQYIDLAGINGQKDTFDFKMIDAEDTDSNISVSFDYIHDQPINFTAINGLVVYSELNVATPRYRTWNASKNIWSAEASATSVGTNAINDIAWVDLHANHERDEFLLGVQKRSRNITLERFNSAGAWDNVVNLAGFVPSNISRAFDIAYEEVTGDALIVYENSTASDSFVAYLQFNGTGYTNNSMLKIGLNANPISRIHLYPKQGSDDIMLIAETNSTNDLYAVPWNGTAFRIDRGVNLTLTSASVDEPIFSFAWASGTDYGLVGFGYNGPNITFRNFSTSTGSWGVPLYNISVGTGESLDAIRMCSDPSSPYIGIIWQDNGNDVNATVWNGSSMIGQTLTEEPTTEGNMNTANIDCSWNATGGYALFVYGDQATNSIDYVNFTKPGTWSPNNLNTNTQTSPTVGGGGRPMIDLVSNPISDTMMMVWMNATGFNRSAGMIAATLWNISRPSGNRFVNTSPEPFEATSEVASGQTQAVMFDWTRYDPPPTVTNIQFNPVFSLQPGDLTVINATVSDNLAVDKVFANISQPNGVTLSVQLLDTDGDRIYNASFNNIAQLGLYTVTIFANDTSTHLNYNSTVFANFTSNNTVPTVISVILSSISGTNMTSENLSLSWNATDPDAGSLFNITDWRINNASIALLNLPFAGSSNGTRTRDYSTFNNTAYLNISMYNSTGGFDGGGAYFFNGTNEILIPPNVSFDIRNNMSFELRFWPNLTGSSLGIMSKANSSDGWRIGIDGSAHPFFELRRGGVINVSTGPVVPQKNWIHVFVNAEYNKSNQLYINGVLIAYNLTNLAVVASNANISIGTKSFTGLVDNVHIYNRTFTAAQILEFNSSANPRILSNTTKPNENWTACVTPTDLFSDGIVSCSNTILTLNDLRFTSYAPNASGRIQNITTETSAVVNANISQNVTFNVTASEFSPEPLTFSWFVNGILQFIQTLFSNFFSSFSFVINESNLSITVVINGSNPSNNETFTFQVAGSCVDADNDGFNKTGPGCGLLDCNDNDNRSYPPQDGDTIYSDGVTFCPGTYLINQSIEISGDNLLVQCNNTILNGNVTSSGLDRSNTTDNTNITIRNCIFANFTTGVEFVNVHNSFILNNTFINVGNPLLLVGTDENDTVENNTFLNISSTPLIASSTNTNMVFRSNKWFNMSDQLLFQSAVNLTFANNYVANGSLNGVGENSTILNNTIFSWNSGSAIQSNSMNVNIINNTITTVSSSAAISMYVSPGVGSSGALIKGNLIRGKGTAIGGSPSGIDVGFANISIINNFIVNVTTAVLAGVSAGNNISIINNTISTVNTGIEAYTSSLVSNNYIFNYTTGIKVRDSYSVIDTNFLNGTGRANSDGILVHPPFSGSQGYNNVTNNTVISTENGIHVGGNSAGFIETSNIIARNIITNATKAIYVQATNTEVTYDNVITNNTLFANYNAIYEWENAAPYSSYNNYTFNRISNNSFGIVFDETIYTDNNTANGSNVFRNTFFNNTQDIFTAGSGFVDGITLNNLFINERSNQILFPMQHLNVTDIDNLFVNDSIAAANTTPEPELNMSANITLNSDFSCYNYSIRRNLTFIKSPITARSVGGIACIGISCFSPSCSGSPGNIFVNFNVNAWSSYFIALNNVSVVQSIAINSTTGYNLTTDDLTATWNTTDEDNDPIQNITDWRVNGTSIAVVNMPFEAPSNATLTKDYSKYGNNGTVINAHWNATGGYNGGGDYDYDGTGYINIGNVMPNISYTKTAWVKRTGPTGFDNIISGSPSHAFWSPQNWCGDSPDFHLISGHNGNWCSVEDTAALDEGVWYFVAVTYDYNSTTMVLYRDGAEVDRNTTVPPMTGGNQLYIGTYDTSANWIGSIDDAAVYNRALSTEEISLLYQKKPYIISGKETRAGENWSACITPNDGKADGVMRCSNNITIRDSVAIISVYPNASNRVQNISANQNNISINQNSSVNITFNATAGYLDNTVGPSVFTFQWFVNGVLQFVQSAVNAILSTFNWIFTNSGVQNVTVVVNGTTRGNSSFTFFVNVSEIVPVVNRIFINSTFGTNLTAENLTVYWNTTDDNKDSLQNITDWRVNGGSIALLNAPFEGGSTATFSRDYSVYGRNLTGVNASWTSSGGYQGSGGYVFDRTGRYLSAPLDPSIITENFSMAAWVKTTDAGQAGVILNFAESLPDGGSDDRELYIVGNQILIYFYPVGAITSGATSVTDGNWHQITATRNDVSGSVLYLDGQVIGTETTPGSVISYTGYVVVGAGGNGQPNFNGTIDNVFIFNRTLSPEQVRLLYTNRTDMLSEKETFVNENWTACVTPNDGITDGNTTCSNNITIRNSAPVVRNVTLNSSFGTNTVVENLTVSYNVTDADNDNIRNITDWRINGTSMALVNMPFEGGSNNTFTKDYSKYGNNATLSGNITWNATGGHDGKGAYVFDGSNQSTITFTISTISSSTVFNKSLSVATWVSLRWNQSQSNPVITMGQEEDGASDIFALHILPNRTAQFYIANQSSSLIKVTADSATTLNYNQWYHLAGTYNGTTLKLYVNGISERQAEMNATQSMIILNSHTVRIGSKDSAAPSNVVTRSFNGTIDDVLIYNRSLSAEEIQLLARNVTDMMSKNETRPGDIWTACVTPNDGLADGNTLCSNNITIKETIHITKIFPNASNQFENITTKINVSFNQSPNVNITFNVTAVTDSGTGPITFSWFVNGILKFVQDLASIFASAFTWITQGTGFQSVTVVVNSTTSGTSSFTFYVNVSSRAPTINNVFINTTQGMNTTTENLTLYWNITDANNDPMKNITDWRVNRTSIMILNMPFEANSSNSTWTKDYSTYGNNGTVTTALWGRNEGHDGFGAYVFDGVSSSDNILIGNVQPTEKYTKMAWIYWGGCTSCGNNIISSSDTALWAPDGFSNKLSSGHNGVWNSVQDSNTLANHTWVFVAITYDSSVASGTMKMYTNGTLISTATGVSAPASGNNLYIGQYGGGGNYFNGTIDDVRIFNRALTADQILNIYNTEYRNNTWNTILGGEIRDAENWSACVTPNDGITDGNTACSNNITMSAQDITVTYPPQYAVIQRTNATVGEIFVTGTYHGTPTSIEASFNGGAYTTIVASPSGRAFRGSFNTSVAQGTLRVRFTNNVGASASVDNVSVGDLFVIAGQSNAVGFGGYSSTLNTSNQYLATVFRSNGWLVANDPVGGVSGSPWPMVADKIIQNQSVPVGFVATAEGGTPMTQWMQGGSNYNNSIGDISNATNGTMRIKSVLYFQGERDALGDIYGGDNTYSAYKGNLTRMAASYINDTAIATTIVVGQINSPQDPNGAVGYFEQVERAQRESWDETNNISAGPTTYDINQSAIPHFSNYDELRVLAERWWASLGAAVYNNVTDGRGPKFINASIVGGDNDTLYVTYDDASLPLNISTYNGTQGGNARGWFLFNGSISLNDTNVTTARLVNSFTVQINFSANITANARVWGGYGVQGRDLPVVRDTSQYKLPAETFHNQTIIISATPTLISFYPNNSGVVQNITTQVNVSINRTVSATTNLTFNITATTSSGALTFSWFVNGVLKFVQSLSSAFTSMFSFLFNVPGSYNVSVVVNGSDSGNNKTFTFFLNVTNANAPTVNNVILNSTFGTNLTDENLTVYWNTTTSAGLPATNITDWRVNGTSIAVLNMPFESATNLTADTSVWTKDYSSYGRNGTVINAFWNRTGGYNGGGAYKFNGAGSNTYIDVPGFNWTGGDPVTVVFWNYVVSGATSGSAFGDNAGGTDRFQAHVPFSDNTVYWDYGTITDPVFRVTASYAAYYNKWTQVVLTSGGRQNTEMAIWLDGVRVATQAGSGTQDFNATDFNIGAWGGGVHNGSIDDFKVYNRVLSDQEIAFLYQNKSAIMSEKETKAGENWSACITPNDGTQDGTTVCSNIVTIRSTSPTINNVILNSTFGTNFTNENLTVYWNATDIDNESLVNITDWRINGTSIALLNMPFEGGSNNTRTKDYSSFSRNGTVNGGSSWNRTGGYDAHGAYRFNGVDAYINTTITLNPSITAIAWAQSAVPSTWNAFGWILSDRGTNGFLVHPDQGGNTVTYGSFDGVGSFTSFGSVTVSDITQWHQYALTFDANSTRYAIYLDGVQASSGTYPGVRSTSSSTLCIGQDCGAGVRFGNGSIDNVLIYNRALSQEEINFTYQNRTNSMSEKETFANENWTACVTPNDGVQDGPTSCSNIVRIRNNISISSVYPNNTGSVVPISQSTANISIVLNGSTQTNLTFNATVSGDPDVFTFTWFVNGVLKFIQTVTNGFTSVFSQLFGTAGKYNITVYVNSTSENAVNDTFTFFVNVSQTPPVVNNVTLNSTFGTNFTDENLTVYWNATSPMISNITNITDWRLKGTSIALLNMPFEGAANGTASTFNWTRDYSIFGNNGTVTNATWNATGGYDGAGGYQFDGSGDQIILANEPMFDLGGKNFSISAWIKVNAFSAVNWQAIIAKGDSAWRLAESSTGNNLAFSTTGLSNVDMGGTVNVNDAKWHYVAATYNGTVKSLYVDGVLDTAVAVTGTLSDNNQFVAIGNNLDVPVRFWNGSVDNVQVFNRSLSPEEIFLIYTNKTAMMSERETRAGENWSACVTPNDGTQDGNTLCSNNVTIRDKVIITTIYPNATGFVQNISGGTNVNVLLNTSTTTNATINITATVDAPTLTFTWFINGVIKFIQTLTSGATSVFSSLFNVSGQYNVSVYINASNDNSVNSTFLFNVTVTTSTIPPPTVTNVTLNSTFGTNFTDENLTVFWNSTSSSGLGVTNITDWRINGTSITVLNMPFDSNNSAGQNKTKDYSTYNNNGTSINGAIWNATAGYDGKGAYIFNGANNSYINITKNVSLEILGNITISMWVKPQVVTGSSFYGLISKRTASDAEFGINYVHVGSTFQWYLISGAQSAVTAPTVPANGVWTHIVTVRNGNIGTIYFNGAVVGSGTFAFAPTVSSASVTIGSSGEQVGEYFNGSIDDVRIYNRALSFEEVSLIYQNKSFVMSEKETKAGENWSACITPNDGTQDGPTVCSNNVTIKDKLIITGIYPNATGFFQNITANVSTVNVTLNTSFATNTTFNITAIVDAPLLTYTWFINGVLKFIQSVASGVTSVFSSLFNVAGQYNVSVYINASNNNAVNSSFTFKVNATTPAPVVSNVILNSTFGTNFTDENLTVFWNSTSNGGYPVTNITDWRINGTSIAVLNMPFDSNNSNGPNKTKDYTTYGNNGTVGGRVAAHWTPDGGIGGTGAYLFTGASGDQIVVNESSVANITDYITFMTWVNITVNQSFQRVMGKNFFQGNNNGSWMMLMDAQARLDCEVYTNTTGGGAVPANSFNLTNGVWHFLACVYNGTRIMAYQDGNKVATSALIDGKINSSYVPVVIGATGNGAGFQNNFNGFIDDVRIYNRALSSEEINFTYQNKSFIMSEKETKAGENWTACITPNDGTQDGTQVCSNQVTIRNKLTITQAFPNATNQSQPINENDNNFSININASLTANQTFNITVSVDDSPALTFRWFVNNVLTFTQNVIGSFTSFFSILFNVAGQYNVTVVVNSTDSGVNDTFTFFVNATRAPPNVSNVILNSTFGTNFTNENLTVYWNTTTSAGLPATNITDWRVNGTSIALLNLPFEGSSNSTFTKDYSTYNNTAAVINGAWNSTGGYNGNGGYHFNGINSYILIANESRFDFSGKTFSISVWFKVDAFSASGDWRVLVGKGDSAWQLRQFSSSNNLAFYTAGLSNDNLVGASNVNDGKWHYAAVVYNGTAKIFYLDGAVDASAAATGILSDNNFNVSISQNLEVPGRIWNGSIDEVQVYTRALSFEEVSLIYQNKSFIMSDKETKAGENWTACITPNDGTQDGVTVCSNQVTIRNKLTIVQAFPNATNQSQPINENDNNFSINVNASLTGNQTFNITISADSAPLTFQWFVNNVLTFTQNVVGSFTSFFSILFNLGGQYNVTVLVNSTEAGVNDTFTFNVNVTRAPPNVSNVILNSTFGTNFTNENLTVYWNTTNFDGFPATNITDWRLNNASIAKVYLPFEGAANTTATVFNWTKDYSTYGNNGTVSGAFWNATGGYDGFGAYQFDGISDFIQIPSFELYNRSFTLSAWARPTNFTQGSGQEMLMSVHTANTIQCSVHFRLINDTSILFGFFSNDLPAPAGSYVFGNWSLFTAVYDNATDTSKIFVNGVQVATGSAGPFGCTNPLISVGRWSSNQFFNGTIDDVRIYDRALTATQIMNLYTNKTNMMSFNETRPNENWSACITPNDGVQDGNTFCSNTVTMLNKINITSFYPNATGQLQPTNGSPNVTLNLNTSTTTNLTFNITASETSIEPLTFTWFVNGVLKFIQTLTSGFTSMFSQLFSIAGQYNVSVTVNGSNPANNQTFTFFVNASTSLPLVTNVTLNSTFGTNFTTENLTVYWNSTSNGGFGVTNITDWRINGTSIAVLNMQFEGATNLTAGTSNWTKDYSTYGNNGTARNVRWNSTGGYDGFGAYVFNNSLDSRIDLGTSQTLNPSAITVMAWIKPLNTPSTQLETIFSNARDCCGSYNGTAFLWSSSYGGLHAKIWNGTSAEAAFNPGYAVDTWHQVAFTYNGTILALYSDGNRVATTATTIGIGSVASFNSSIGAGGFGNVYSFNGSIDDFRIYNRALSPEEINFTYQNKSYIMSEKETKKGENWTACITPNDGVQDGVTQCSNIVTIRNAPPTNVTLITPNNGNNTLINLNVTFNWTSATDADGDPITYFLNLTSQSCTNSYYGPISSVPFLSPELRVTTDCGYYNWSVIAFDGTDYSTYSNLFNFSIMPYVNVSFVSGFNLTDFGNMRIGERNDTVDNNPFPFVVESDSNVFVNVSVRALDPLWDKSGLNNATFMFAARNATVSPAFNLSQSARNFTNVTSTAKLVFNRLDFHNNTNNVANFVNGQNTGIIDINVTVPPDEPAGTKSSILIVEGTQTP